VDGNNDVMDWQSMAQSTIGIVWLSSLNITLDRVNQTVYRSGLRACNTRHCSSIIYSDGFILNNEAPEFIVIDSTSESTIINSIITSISTSSISSKVDAYSSLAVHDIDTQTSLETLTLIWLSTQPSATGIPIVSTEIAIGACSNDTAPLLSSPYMTSIVQWTLVPTNISSINGFTFGFYTADSLVLLLDDTYCSYIRLTDVSSNTMIFTSNGVRIRNQPPTAGIVYDVASSNQIIDMDVSTSYSIASVYWTGFGGDGTPLIYNITLVAIDTSLSLESLVINGGSYENMNVNDYEVIQMTTIATMTLNSTSNRATIASLSLASFQLYRWIVCATNSIDLSVCSMSNGFIVDVTPPLEGDVIIGNRSTSLTVQYLSCCLMVHWNGFIDLESGMIMIDLFTTLEIDLRVGLLSFG
jgi:hypothetical protein